MKLQIKKISISEFEQLEKQIIDNDQTFDQIYETWKILDDFFVQNSYEKDFDWRMTYFRVYVRLTWKVLGTIVDSNKFIEIMRRQVPMAIILDINILQQMMWFLAFNKEDKNQLISLYQKIRLAVLESEQVIGSWQNSNVTVKDLASEYLLMQQRGVSSIEEAEFLSKVKQIMFPKEIEQYIFVNQDEGVDRFLELVEFFDYIDNEKIWTVVDVFLNPEKYNVNKPEDNKLESEQELEGGEEKVEEPTPQISANKYESMSQKLDEEIKAAENSVVPAAPVVKIESEKPFVAKPAPQAPAVEEQTKLSASQIKSQIESEFKQDLDGNFEDIEGVMRKLEEFAEMYNDPKISDMIYFDEEDDKFKWKV